MRRIILLTICLIGLYARADVLQVGVTIPPQKEPVLAVMGTNVQVRILMEGNQNPATAEEPVQSAVEVQTIKEEENANE